MRHHLRSGLQVHRAIAGTPHLREGVTSRNRNRGRKGSTCASQPVGHAMQRHRPLVRCRLLTVSVDTRGGPLRQWCTVGSRAAVLPEVFGGKCGGPARGLKAAARMATGSATGMSFRRVRSPRRAARRLSRVLGTAAAGAWHHAHPGRRNGRRNASTALQRRSPSTGTASEGAAAGAARTSPRNLSMPAPPSSAPE